MRCGVPAVIASSISGPLTFWAVRLIISPLATRCRGRQRLAIVVKCSWMSVDKAMKITFPRQPRSIRALKVIPRE